MRKTSLLLVFIIFISAMLVSAQTVGPAVPSSFTNTGNWNDFSNFDRSFTVISSINLKSVKVVPVSHWSLCSGATSSLTIDLYKDGVRIDDFTATVNCGAINTIDLNFELLSGFYELRIRNVDNGQMALSNDASEKSITDMILLNEQPDSFSGAFFDWVVEGKTGPVITLPDTVRICPGQTYDLNFGAYNGERWASDEPYTTIDDANIRLEPTQSTVYYFEKPTLIPAGENIVLNGDFEAGNTGFTSEYTLNTALTTRGDYIVGNNASIPLSVGADYNPGTTSGNMLVTKATPAGSGVKDAWCQTIDVFPNTTYQAEFRVKSGAFSNNPFITASFNGGNWNFENTGSTWALYNQTWNSGSNTTLEYCIQNHLAETDGNIMLIDDVKLLSADPILAYSAVDQVVVIVESVSTIDLGADAKNCDLATSPVTLDAGSDWDSYTWSPGGQTSQTISVNAPGTYLVATTKSGGCTGTGNITFTANACTPTCTNPNYSLMTGLQPVCQGETADFDLNITAGTAPFTIYYSIDGVAQTPLTGLALGTHILTMNSTQTTIRVDSVNGGGCTTKHPFIVASSGISGVNPLPSIDLGNITTICDDGTTPLTLDAGTGATYAWAPNNETSKTITVNAAGTYQVTVTNDDNCSNTESITITETPCGPVCTSDNDNDGVCDDVDLDDDNDGILDELECNTSGTNDFQWSSVPSVSGNTATGTINGISYTYTSSTPVETTGNLFSHGIFPASYSIPNTTSIKNTKANTNTLVFDSPVLNPVLIFASIGSPSIAVPIDFNHPIEVLWSKDITINSTTKITGTEGYAIVRMNGTFNSISFDYLVDEIYANFMFGGDFVPSCGTCDIDNDTKEACFDNDSDGDGCFDALEGDGGVLASQLDANGMITGGVDANGVPLLIGSSGQGLGSSLDTTTESSECVVCTADFDNDGVCDDIDLDDDNDGILDSEECASTDFQWSSSPTVAGNTATGTFNGINYTYTSDQTVQTETTFQGASAFPSEYSINLVSRNIKNLLASSNTITFDQPVRNPILAFGSIGNAGTFVKVQFSDPVEIVWSNANVSQNSATEIEGNEGHALIRLNGTFTTFSFDYLTAENRVNFAFGADFSCNNCDIDNDSFTACYDTDSDNDGCFDALEGNGGILVSQLGANGMITGGVDANGIPLAVSGGQGDLSSTDDAVLGPECTCTPPVDPIINEMVNDTIQVCTSNSTKDLADYIVGTNVIWYTTASSNDGTSTSPVINNSVAGITAYWVTQTIDCESNRVRILYNVNAIPDLTITSPVPICAPLLIDLTATGATSGSTLGGGSLTYYSDAEATLPLSTPTAVSTGTYYILASNGYCSDTAEVHVTVNNKPILAITDPVPVCEPALIDLTDAAITIGSNLEGGTLSYFSDADAANIYPNPSFADSAIYFIVTTTPENCSDTAQINAIVHQTPSLVINPPAATCFPKTVDITSSLITERSILRGSTLSYFNNSQATNTFPSPSEATRGDYFIVANTGFCSDTATINVIIHNKPILTITDPSPVCSPQLIDLTDAAITTGSNLEGGTLSYFSDADAANIYTNPSFADSATYFIVTTTPENCSDTAQINAIVHQTPSLVINPPAATCFPKTVDITSSLITKRSILRGSTLSYFINSQATNTLTSPSEATRGDYFIVANTGFCSDTATINVVVNPLPEVSINLPADICFKDGITKITTIPSTGGTLSGKGVIDQGFNPQDDGLIVEQGTYIKYEYTDTNTCTNRDSSMITVHMEPILTPLFIDTTICIDEEVLLLVGVDQTSDYEWFLKEDLISEASFLYASEAGRYTIQANSAYCQAEQVAIEVNILNPKIELSTNNVLVSEGDEFEITVADASFKNTYEWLDETTGTNQTGALWSAIAEDNTTITATAKQQHCEVSEIINVQVLLNLVIPSAFTPNGDSVNDEWVIQGLESYNQSSIKVFNRWGALVYENYNRRDFWDGKRNGIELAVGTYYYVITINEFKEKSFAGDVTILR